MRGAGGAVRRARQRRLHAAAARRALAAPGRRPGAAAALERGGLRGARHARAEPAPGRAGAARFARDRRPVAWKTGTSHGFRDAWAVGRVRPLRAGRLGRQLRRPGQPGLRRRRGRRAAVLPDGRRAPGRAAAPPSPRRGPPPGLAPDRGVRHLGQAARSALPPDGGHLVPARHLAHRHLRHPPRGAHRPLRAPRLRAGAGGARRGLRGSGPPISSGSSPRRGSRAASRLPRRRGAGWRAWRRAHRPGSRRRSRG